MTNQDDTGPGNMPAPQPYREPKAGLPVPLDMTNIYKWEALAEEVTRINGINGPFYMQEFSRARDICSSYYCQLVLDYERAKNKTKTEAALAYLERSQAYIKEKGLKDTDETKKQYVQIDKAYNSAKDQEDMLKALVTLLGNKVEKFKDCHDDAKKIYDRSTDPRGSLPAMPSGKDSQ